MKLFRILLLVVGSTTAILASTSPSYALEKTFDLNPINLNGTGLTATGTATFDDSLLAPNSSSGNYSDLSGLDGFSFNVSDGARFDLSNLQAWVLEVNSAGGLTDLNFFGNGTSLNGNGSSLEGTDYFQLSYYAASGTSQTFQLSLDPNGGTLGSATVPFDIPGGATIPSVGAVLALGAMRKARKSIASKTRLANPVCASIS